MAIICRSYKLLFIMTPRTACSALGKLLCEKLEGEFIPSEDILDSKGFFKIQKKHNTIKQLLEHKFLTVEEAASYLKFTTVRNPFDSLVSLYFKKHKKYQPLLSDPNSWVYRVPGYVEDMKFCKTHSFDEWILNKYRINLAKRIFGRGKGSLFNQYTKGVDTVIYFENIHNDFQKIMTQAGISPKLSIPEFNQTLEREKDYRKYYKKETQKIIEYVYQNDLKKYGYKF